MRAVTEVSPVEEFTDKLPEVYLADEQEEVLLEPGDILISSTAGWNEVLDALVRHAQEYMPAEQWNDETVLNELARWV